jgi:hypothetical protein
VPKVPALGFFAKKNAEIPENMPKLGRKRQSSSFA